MQLFHRKPKLDPKAFSANLPHPYIAGGDAGVGAVGTTSVMLSGAGGGPAGAAVTNRYQQTVGCAVPGCGKAPADDIHAPAD